MVHGVAELLTMTILCNPIYRICFFIARQLC